MLDIMNNDAFSIAQLTASVNKIPFKPGKISAMGIFDEDGVTTTSVNVEWRDGILTLVDAIARGAAGQTSAEGKRKMESFVIPHLLQPDTILADAVQNVRAFGTEDQVEPIMGVVNQRMTALGRNLEYTSESHRVAAIQGKYFDAFGAEASLFTKFGVTEKTVAMGLTADNTPIRAKCNAIIDAVEDAMGGAAYDGITAVCSKEFFDLLIEYPAVKEAYLNSQANAELRGNGTSDFMFGGILWVRYNGTTDVKIAAGEARAFPTGADGLFITRYAPAPYNETVNTVGLPMYAKTWPMEGDKGYNLEVQSNQLNICTRPEALIKLKKTTT